MSAVGKRAYATASSPGEAALQSRLACLSATAIVLATGSASAHQPQGHSSATYRLPEAASSVPPIAGLPTYSSQFFRDLDLPEPSYYQHEIVRVVTGGFFPATVTQIAVALPGQPVQVLVVSAQRRESLLIEPAHVPTGAKWAVTSRKLASMSWKSYVQLRFDILACIGRIITKTQRHTDDPHKLHFGCTDDGGGSLAYGSGRPSRFFASLSGCEDNDVREIEQRVIKVAATLTKDEQETLP